MLLIIDYHKRNQKTSGIGKLWVKIKWDKAKMDRFRLKNARVIIPRLETLEVFVNSKARRDESDNNTDTDESEENKEDVF